MMKLLTDPAIFNYVILALYTASTIRWAIAGNVAWTIYWAGAALLQLSVTFFLESK